MSETDTKERTLSHWPAVKTLAYKGAETDRDPPYRYDSTAVGQIEGFEEAVRELVALVERKESDMTTTPEPMRYDLHYERGCMRCAIFGTYVLYSDYAALLAEVVALRKTKGRHPMSSELKIGDVVMWGDERVAIRDISENEAWVAREGGNRTLALVSQLKPIPVRAKP